MTALCLKGMGELFTPSHAKELAYSDANDRVWQIPDPFGRGYIREIELGAGLSLVILDCELVRDLCKDVALFQTSLEFEFCIAGENPGANLTVLHLGDCKPVHLPAGQHCLWVEVFVAAPRLEAYFYGLLAQLSPKLKQLAEQYFEKLYCDRFEALPANSQIAIQQILKQPVALTSQAADLEMWQEFEQVLSGKTTAAMQAILKQILSCSYQGMSRQLYLESKAIELIALRFEQIAQLSRSRSPLKKLSAEDIEKIHRARKILQHNLKQPPSLINLARRVGLNDCTLKRGFQQAFGMTAFECLAQFRMQRAQQLLEAGEMGVSQVATAVGYTSRSAFYTAFRKQFGVSPNEYLIQNRRNSV